MHRKQQSLELSTTERAPQANSPSEAHHPDATSGPVRWNRSFIMHRVFELARFVITGTFAAVLNVLIVMFLTERVGLHYLVSVGVCFVTVTFVSFWMNRSWTFRKRDPGAGGDLARYLCTTFVQMGLSVIALSICVEVLHIPYPIAMLLLSAAFVPVTYLLHRRWSFRLRWFGQHQ